MNPRKFGLSQVLGNGEMLEFDRPTVLLSNSESYFVSLVEQTGPAEAEYLRVLANRTNTKMKEEKLSRTEHDASTISENETDPLLV